MSAIFADPGAEPEAVELIGEAAPAPEPDPIVPTPGFANTLEPAKKSGTPVPEPVLDEVGAAGTGTGAASLGTTEGALAD